ncbi:MAG: hypothetical protein ABI822_06240 [Bryobacteraceae bacterium]
MIESNGFASRKQAKQVVALGRKHTKTAYPNRNRDGCPEPSKLRAMAFRDHRCKLADLPVSHIATCSPCFEQYMLFRRSAFILKTFQISAAAVVLLGVLFTWVKFIHTSSYDGGEILAHTRPQTPITEPPQGILPEPTLAVQVNLASFSVARGENSESATKRIHLPAKALEITFRLPVGMEPGTYAVRLLDSDGSAVVDREVSAHLADGITTFAMDVELGSAVSGAQWTLMIRESGMSWRKYPVIVD